jgi:hypothetical protein
LSKAIDELDTPTATPEDGIDVSVVYGDAADPDADVVIRRHVVMSRRDAVEKGHEIADGIDNTNDTVRVPYP